jgi:hypothetical protein
MNFDFKNNTEFLNLLRTKKQEIIDKTSDYIYESEGYKIVFAGLKSMLKNNDFHGSKLITFEEGALLKVGINTIGNFDDLFKTDSFTFNQKILVDETLKIVSAERLRLPEDSNIARDTFTEESEKTGIVIFLLIKGKVNSFVKGKVRSESLFFSLSDVNRYNEKKEINQISDVLKDYQESLKDKKTYCKFFIGLSHIKSLHIDLKAPDDINEFIKKYKHLLRNKPEDTFRDDLREYLQRNVRISQIKEYLLENLKRLDIYLFDDFGEVYLIEVKWVGNSVHHLGKKLGTSYNEKDINPAAFKQTLAYLDDLAKKGQNIVRAFLVVFDARKDDQTDTGQGINTTLFNDIEKRQYSKFQKMSDLRVVNFHPS